MIYIYIYMQLNSICQNIILFINRSNPVDLPKIKDIGPVVKNPILV